MANVVCGGGAVCKVCHSALTLLARQLEQNRTSGRSELTGDNFSRKIRFSRAGEEGRQARALPRCLAAMLTCACAHEHVCSSVCLPTCLCAHVCIGGLWPGTELCRGTTELVFRKDHRPVRGGRSSDGRGGGGEGGRGWAGVPPQRSHAAAWSKSARQRGSGDSTASPTASRPQ